MMVTIGLRVLNRSEKQVKQSEFGMELFAEQPLNTLRQRLAHQKISFHNVNLNRLPQKQAFVLEASNNRQLLW